MNRIYIVYGTCSDWSDHTEWFVASYTTDEQAHEHLRRLTEALKTTNWTKAKKEERKAARARIKELDPESPRGDTGWDYQVVEVSLFRHLDEFLENPR